jgi:hypothetical protein
MNLVQLIELAAQGASVELIGTQHTPHADAEMLVVYMEDQISPTSQLAFFDFEQVPPTMVITVGGKRYQSFFSASELDDMIPDYFSSLGQAATPLAVAKALLHYHEYDA